jgi:hypothetical protein
LPLNKLVVIGKNAAQILDFKDIIAEEVNVKNIEIQEKFYDYLENNRTLYFTDEVIDLHPLPKDHLQVIEKYFSISQETKDWVIQNDDLLRKNLPINFHKVSPERL